MCTDIGVRTILCAYFQACWSFNISVLKVLFFKLNQKTHTCYYWPSNSPLSVLPIIVII
jgi:hypothetical protein